ncbi:MAG: hypothetical protein LBC27_07575 [Spirochaetaceae bacterium]|jgi:ABC-type bacteriocin/lantibiotic exporter with double-glycine peptidase domain|nr:hypothetical protein [Spirochaetaceae bacterium]
MKYQYQIDETGCGPACLVMTASYYKLYISIGHARELCKADRMGTNLGGLAEAAQKLYMNAKPMRGEVADKTELSAIGAKIFVNIMLTGFVASLEIIYRKNS